MPATLEAAVGGKVVPSAGRGKKKNGVNNTKLQDALKNHKQGAALLPQDRPTTTPSHLYVPSLPPPNMHSMPPLVTLPSDILQGNAWL